MKVCVVQVNSRDDKEDNLQKVGRLIEQAAADGAELISLPEYVNFLGKDSEKRSQAESIPGPTSEFFMEKAKELGIYLHCGSILEVADDTTSYNTSLLISDAGEIIATYRKMHLFDVDIAGRVVTKESDTIKPGQQVVTADTPFGTVGLGICYDLRFPELYRSMALRGAKLLFVPAAFTLYTGIHHWEVLLRARAIENQCYVLAAGQFGSYALGRTSFGSSMIVDPWGTVLARVPEREGYAIAEVDFDWLDGIRRKIPCLAHRHPALYSEGLSENANRKH